MSGREPLEEMLHRLERTNEMLEMSAKYGITQPRGPYKTPKPSVLVTQYKGKKDKSYSLRHSIDHLGPKGTHLGTYDGIVGNHYRDSDLHVSGAGMEDVDKLKMQEIDNPLWGPKKDLASSAWRKSPSYLQGIHVSPRHLEDVLMSNAHMCRSFEMNNPMQESDWSPTRISSDQLGERPLHIPT
eukprot:CAMPEP_0198216650 /NCGR_PEP_ID=MMETSP1445-20131203/58836_1 /TAXON_ID=36898 /ORGANISM="Pyramimonas sp., Strain CCMP2087" /LENGTH=183 /DNA_ID=CAMNT_0043892979 /DNA_START=252 /DNA_END=799 /DNA_ORIENTATION=+